MTVRDALKVAEDRELDLVEVSPTAVPPVCKILDFGKYKYQLNKKHTQKKTVSIKEVKVRPQVGEHDLELKYPEHQPLYRGWRQGQDRNVFQGQGNHKT